MDDNLKSIVEDYISDSLNGKMPNQNSYSRRLQKTKKSEEEIHEILIEINDDCIKEISASSGVRNAKKMLLLSAIGGLILATVSIISALGFLFQDKTTVLFFGGVAASIIYGAKNYRVIKSVEQRKKRRALKWSNWN
jgi:hypothetical protein